MTDGDPPPKRDDYAWLLSIPTRWMDNDVYGHVNNVVFYSYFDTIINRWLIDEGGLDIHGGAVIGLCVESQCRYLAPASYPEVLEGALRVGHLGRSSVRYEIGIFRPNTEEPCAFGHFVHVFVDRASRRATAMPEQIRSALERISNPGIFRAEKT
ncbi:MAG TPA: thioesterase family protein [Labilithrix sp.]|jgi:acyl-CoA thioester hydrolase